MYWGLSHGGVQVARADGVTRGVYSIGRCVLMLLFWIAAFVLLMLAFLAQFSWFPWPDTTLIGDEAPRTFFRECAPRSMHACVHRGTANHCKTVVLAAVPRHHRTANHCSTLNIVAVHRHPTNTPPMCIVRWGFPRSLPVLSLIHI